MTLLAGAPPCPAPGNMVKYRPVAQGISDGVIEDIKSRIDLGDLISSYGVAVKRAGSSLVACCPFHNEKTPSFHINVSKGFYHCFGCGENGDAIKFVQRQEGLSFVEAVKKLAAQCGIEIAERHDPEAARRKRLFALMAELAQFYHRCLASAKEAAAAREYLAKRRLDGNVQDDWLLGYAPNGMSAIKKWAEKYGYTLDEVEAAGVVKAPNGPSDDGYHRFAGRLMFPIRDRQGRVVGFSGRQLVENKRSGKYVNSPETPVFKKSDVLFGFDRASREIVRSPHREVICCEGQIDTIRLHLNGFTTAVGSQGTAFTEEHARMIKRVADSAVLMYDDDAAGHKATVKVARLLLALGMPVRVVSLPGGDDPDSYLSSHPPADLQALVDGAESIACFQCRVERAKEQNPDSIDAVSRVSREVLATIAASTSAVLRASLVDEAAKLLKLPAAALAEELAKAAAGAPRAPSRAASAASAGGDAPGDGPPAPDGGPDSSGDDAAPAALALPPPAGEMEFMGFLLANEYDAETAAVTGELLPHDVFAHEFTRRFTLVYLAECEKGEDLMAAFADSLPPGERAWFDRAVAISGNTEVCGRGHGELLQEFVRTLWCERLAREKGALPAAGSREDAERLYRLSFDRQTFRRGDWNAVRRLISEKKKEGDNKDGPKDRAV